MTYCLGMLFQDGLVLGSDSRTNAGVDQIATVRKLATFVEPGERMIALQTAGNLATTQAVVTELRQAWGSVIRAWMKMEPTLFEAARIVGDKLRAELTGRKVSSAPTGIRARLPRVRPDPWRAPRLFQIPAGNFIEASPRTQFLQIGETKCSQPFWIAPCAMKWIFGGGDTGAALLRCDGPQQSFGGAPDQATGRGQQPRSRQTEVHRNGSLLDTTSAPPIRPGWSSLYACLPQPNIRHGAI